MPAQAGIQAIFGEPLRWRRLRQQQLRKHRLDPSFRWDDGVGALGPCGAYFGAGFHEDGLQAGLAVAEALGGVRRPWIVEDESGRIYLPAAHETGRVAA